MATTGAVLVVSQSPHGTEEVRALATGKTLLFLTSQDVALLAWSLPPLIVAALIWSGPLSAAAFDRDHARVAGHPVLRLETGLAAGLMLLMAPAAPRAGAPLLFANLTLPPFAAERLVGRPAPVVAVSILIALLGFLLGATAAVQYDLPFSTASIAGALAMAGVAVLVGATASLIGRLLRRRASG